MESTRDALNRPSHKPRTSITDELSNIVAKLNANLSSSVVDNNGVNGGGSDRASFRSNDAFSMIGELFASPLAKDMGDGELGRWKT